jgi:hypothetical protein
MNYTAHGLFKNLLFLNNNKTLRVCFASAAAGVVIVNGMDLESSADMMMMTSGKQFWRHVWGLRDTGHVYPSHWETSQGFVPSHFEKRKNACPGYKG